MSNRQYSIQLSSYSCNGCATLFESVKSVLNVTNPQFYNPFFDYIDPTTHKAETVCLQSKYRLIAIDYIIDSDAENDEEEGYIEDVDVNETGDETGDLLEDKLPLANDIVEVLPDQSKLLMEVLSADTELVCKIRMNTEEDKIFNCIPLMATVEKFDTHTQIFKQYKNHKIFCKKSPLLEPLKILMDEQMNITTETDIQLITEQQLSTTTNKINSVNNASHVEALALHCLSKLTEAGYTPTFPYYFGCINGISNYHFHNITEEFEDIYNKKWFIDKSKDPNFEIVYIDVENSTNASEICSNHTDGDGDNISLDQEGTELDKILDDRLKQLNTEKISALITPEDDDEFKIADYDSGDEDEIIYSKTGTYPVTGTSNLTVEEDDDISLDNIYNMKQFIKNKIFYLKVKNMPVNYCFMERLHTTLDELLDTALSEDEIIAILFQIIFGLAVANKEYSFVHNDLHSDNILFTSTNEKFLYFYANGKYYKIPTFGRVPKIIDFARATFIVNGTTIFSDVFKTGNDAAGQYLYPGESPDNFYGADVPNPGFDIPRLARTIIDKVDNYNKIRTVLRKWCVCDDGTNILDKDDDFDLYIDIARNCHQSIPNKIINDKIFSQFTISKFRIPTAKHIYRYH